MNECQWWGLGHEVMAEAGRGGPSCCRASPAQVLLPEYGPVGLLLLLPIDDTGEQPEGFCTCGEGDRLEEGGPSAARGLWSRKRALRS